MKRTIAFIIAAAAAVALLIFPLSADSGGEKTAVYDFDRDGEVTSDDAVYLLRAVLYPDRYPLCRHTDAYWLVTSVPTSTAPGEKCLVCRACGEVLAAEEMAYSQLNSAPYTDLAAYGFVPGKIDAAAFEALITGDACANKVFRFGDGVYEFSDTVNIPSDVTLEGCASTVLTLDPESSSKVLLNISEADNVRLCRLTVRGSLDSRPAEAGDRTGIRVVKARSVNIEDVDITGWSLYGLYGKTMSSYGAASDGAFFKQLQIVNCRFYYNYYGAYYDYRCEYTQTLDCVFGENNTGTLNAGGNNVYTGCMWNCNRYGFVMENSGSNPAHGGCVSCTFNHNSSHAVLVSDCVNGWTFDGCQIFYGKIELCRSRGVIFTGNVWGSCRLEASGCAPDSNVITGTYFLTDSDTILKQSSGAVYVSCCLPDKLGAVSAEESGEESGG